MGVWKIYHKDVTIRKDANRNNIDIRSLEYSDAWMGECYLTRREKREVTEQLGIYKIGADARPSGVVVIPNKVTTLATRVF